MTGRARSPAKITVHETEAPHASEISNFSNLEAADDHLMIANEQGYAPSYQQPRTGGMLRNLIARVWNQRMEPNYAVNITVDDLSSRPYYRFENTPAPKKGMHKGYIIAFYIGMWLGLSGLLSCFNKYILDTKHYNFPFPMFLTACQGLVHYIITCFFLFALNVEPSFRHLKMDLVEYVKSIVICGVASGLDIGLSNASLRFITLSFYTMVKSATPISALGFAFALKLEKPSISLIAIILVIFSGVLLTVWSQTEINMTGFTLIIAACVMSGLRWSLVQVLLHGETKSLNHPLVVMYYLAPVVAFSLFTVSAIVESFQIIFSSDYFSTSRNAIITLGFIFASGVLSLLMIIAEYQVLSYTSAITLSVIGIAKELMFIAIGMIVFGDILTILNITGFVISLCGVILYNYLRIQKTQLVKATSPHRETYMVNNEEFMELQDVESLPGFFNHLETNDSDNEAQEIQVGQVPFQDITPKSFYSRMKASKRISLIYNHISRNANLLLGLSVVSWFIFSALLSSLNKYTFGTYNYNFPFPLFLTSINAITHFFVASIILYGLNYEPEFRLASTPKVSFYVKFILGSAFFTAIDLGFSNASLKLITVSFLTMLKCSTLVFALSFSFLFGLEKPSLSLVAIISLISIGVFLVAIGENNFNLTGFEMAIISSFSSGLRWTFVHIILLKSTAVMKNPVVAMYYISPLVAAFLFVGSAVFEGIGEIFSSEFFTNVNSTLIVIGIFVTAGILSLGLMLSEFYVILNSSVLTFSVFTVMKDIVIMSVSAKIYGDTFSTLNLVGFLLSLIGIIAYNYIRKQDDKYDLISLQGRENEVIFENDIGENKPNDGFVELNFFEKKGENYTLEE